MRFFRSQIGNLTLKVILLLFGTDTRIQYDLRYTLLPDERIYVK